jgi:hypothetical protein
MGGMDMRVKQGLVAATLAIVLLVLTATPALASEYVLTPTTWSHNGTTIRATLGISDDFFQSDFRAFVKYRKDAGGGTYNISISNLKLYRDGVVVKNISGGPFSVSGSWQYFQTSPIGVAGSCDILKATATVTFRHTNGDGHVTTRSLATAGKATPAC